MDSDSNVLEFINVTRARFDKIEVHTTSSDLGWFGVEVKAGSNTGVDIDDVMVDGHYIAINLSNTPISYQARNNDGEWSEITLEPNAIWINPEGLPFSMRHKKRTCWGTCVVSGVFLDSIMGCHYELSKLANVKDEMLSHLFLSLISAAQDKNRHSFFVSKNIIAAFISAVAIRHGKPSTEHPLRGGIAPNKLLSLFKWLEQHYMDPINVDDMAKRVMLSSAHFSREFKRSVSISPWEYVVNLRLGAAKDLIKDGVSVKEAAARCGFSDQFHLSRLFKKRYGMSPSALSKK